MFAIFGRRAVRADVILPSRFFVRVIGLIAMLMVAFSTMAQEASPPDAQPVMLARDTHIWVNHDGSFDVSDITRFRPAPPHGFHRDLVFPGRKLEPHNVFLMGASENHYPVQAELVPLGDGMRINVHPMRSIWPKSFEIDYRMRYLAADEGRLEWPLISSSSKLPLGKARLRVSLPGETPSNQIHAHFLLDGSKVEDGEVRIKGSRVSLDWPDGVAPGQTLSAVITYPKLVAERQLDPPRGPAWMFNGPLWLALLALYYFAAKMLFTGGGKGKPVIVEYEAPRGWSAGAARLLWHGSWDNKCFATGVLGIAAKGGLALVQAGRWVWVATRAGEDYIPTLTADERSLRSALFAFGHSAPFSGANADSTGIAKVAFRRTLEARCATEHPADPALLLIPGWLIALTAATLLFLGSDSRFALVGEIFVPTVIGAFALAVFLGMVPRALLRAIRAQAIFAAVVCALGLLGDAGWTNWLTGTALLAGQVAAGWWLLRQAPNDTPLLRKLRGFRWYLGTAEQQEMEARYKPSLHPELQASYLPYAMALDVEVKWNARFSGSLATTSREADFTASLNPDHDQAAMNLLAFARAMTRQSESGEEGGSR